MGRYKPKQTKQATPRDEPAAGAPWVEGNFESRTLVLGQSSAMVCIQTETGPCIYNKSKQKSRVTQGTAEISCQQTNPAPCTHEGCITIPTTYLVCSPRSPPGAALALLQRQLPVCKQPFGHLAVCSPTLLRIGCRAESSFHPGRKTTQILI